MTLPTIAPKSVQTCVTSPPYYGLRDYGTAKWEGGDPNCDHRFRDNKRDSTSTLAGTSNKEGFALNHYKSVCGKCGAIRMDVQIGLEQTPEEYIAKLVAVFRLVRDALKDDGTLWLNLGDSYTPQSTHKAAPGTRGGYNARSHDLKDRIDIPAYGKPKDLMMIPARVALALQADGWYLRSEIVWHKPNPMPESVRDRPTKAHEMIYLLAKSQRYFYDAEAVREPLAESTRNDPRMNDMGRTYNGKGRGAYGEEGKANGSMQAWSLNPAGRNRRDVWTVTTKPYKGAHFATFPPDLIEPCILAGSRKGDIVLDPFNGSGTTGAVALKHGREYIGCELNEDYIKLTEERLAKVQIEY